MPDVCDKIKSELKIPCTLTLHRELQIVADNVGIDVLKSDRFTVDVIAGWFKIGNRKFYFNVDKDFEGKYRATIAFLISINNYIAKVFYIENLSIDKNIDGKYVLLFKLRSLDWVA